MILTRTPLRVSFVGGGTDLPGFFTENEYGCVISTGIQKYVYIGVNARFDGKIRLAYSRNELVESIEEIENDRMKEAMRKVGIEGGIEIFYISDVPKQLGLGGSSSFTVGLLHALYRFKGEEVYPERLAREACEIEIDILGNPIGKQDQYAAALGGMNYLKFLADGTVTASPILIDQSLLESMLDNLLFIYLGQSHDASAILRDVQSRMGENATHFLRLRDLTDELYRDLMRGNTNALRGALKTAWELKKKTSGQVSAGAIDELLERARQSGAEAGKVLGAGGGGFLLVWVPADRQARFLEQMANWTVMRFAIDHYGTQVVHAD